MDLEACHAGLLVRRTAAGRITVRRRDRSRRNCSMKITFSRRTFLASAAATVPSAFAQRHPGSLYSLLAATGGGPAFSGPWSDSGVIDVSHSPFARIRSVPIRAVEIQEGFWSRRRATNVGTSIPSMLHELVAHRRMTNFQRLA